MISNGSDIPCFHFTSTVVIKEHQAGSDQIWGADKVNTVTLKKKELMRYKFWSSVIFGNNRAPD